MPFRSGADGPEAVAIPAVWEVARRSERPRLSREVASEFWGALLCDLDGSGLWSASDPAVPEHGVEEFRAVGVGGVLSSLGPVEAGTTSGSFAGYGGVDV